MALTLLVIFAVCLLSVFLIYYLLNGITPAPTTKMVKDKVLEILPEEVEGTIYELGAGWGGLALKLAKRFPNSDVVGIENFFVPYLVATTRARLTGRRNLRFKLRNFYSYDLSDADLVTCYLYRGAMERLKPKFESELRSGALVLSHTFSVPGWEPIREELVENIYLTPLYLYSVS